MSILHIILYQNTEYGHDEQNRKEERENGGNENVL
jgi:hypothetical protein